MAKAKKEKTSDETMGGLIEVAPEPTESQVPALSDEEFRLLLIEDAGKGTENGKSKVYFDSVRLAQNMTPQVQRGGEDYIDGLQPGDLFNASAQRRYGEALPCIPVSYRRVFIEWEKREDGRDKCHGVVPISWDEYNDLDRIDGKAYKVLPNGNQVWDTGFFNFLALHQDPETGEYGYDWAEMRMQSTGLDCYRNWDKLINAQKIEDGSGDRITLPAFACVYRLETSSKKNAKGQPYFVVSPRLMGRVTDQQVYMAAKAYYEEAIRAAAEEMRQAEERWAQVKAYPAAKQAAIDGAIKDLEGGQADDDLPW